MVRLRGPSHLYRNTDLPELLVVLVDVVPVYDAEELVDVVGAAVLVLEIVGVLPHVEAEDGHAADAELARVRRRRPPLQRVLLVGSRADVEPDVAAGAVVPERGGVSDELVIISRSRSRSRSVVVVVVVIVVVVGVVVAGRAWSQKEQKEG